MTDIRTRPIRIRTLINLCGRPKMEIALHGDCRSDHIVTVHHEESRFRLWAEVGPHPVNVFAYLIFKKPVPRANETLVLGTDAYSFTKRNR